MTTPITLEQAQLALNYLNTRNKLGTCSLVYDPAKRIADYITQQAERLRVANEALQFYADCKHVHYTSWVNEKAENDAVRAIVAKGDFTDYNAEDFTLYCENGAVALAALAAQREG